MYFELSSIVLSEVLFYFFSSVSLLSAVMVIAARNPIHSVLFLILVFCNVAGLLILLQIEFLAMLFLIVYVGAIAVLFLFVVMMLNINLIELNENLLRYLPIGGLIAMVFLLEIYLIVDSDLSFTSSSSPDYVDWSLKIDGLSNIETIGEVMYTHYFFLFLVAGVILLVSMIGAIVLTLSQSEEVRRQDIFKQVSRDFNKTIVLRS